MGSKGSNTTTTNQTQTYNPAGAGYVQGALNQATNAAQLPFNIPQAPVAGFSQDQQSAFNTVNGAQGQAQPYYNQAANYFDQSTTPDVSQFLNPYASAVTAQMNNVFGQQQAQTTGQLTQAAGGVGADRIAVGQSQLANQQGLAAGQTLSSLYAPSLSAAQQQQSLMQGAGYGTASLGSQSQNAALTGAQAQLATGGLQQQLSQAQMNSPYQQQLAQAAFPYQQAQFLAGITGSLAPGLGGTTTGQGSTTSPAPSLLSQILGLGTAGVGIAGGLGAFSPTSATNPKGSSPSYGGGNMYDGSAYGGSASNPLPGLSASDYGSARGGAVPYARGGHIHSPYYDDGGKVLDRPVNGDPIATPRRQMQWDAATGRVQTRSDMDAAERISDAVPRKRFADGGTPGQGGSSVYSLPAGLSDSPINVDQQSIIPTGQVQAIQTHQPNLNLNPQTSAGSGNSASSVASAIGSAAKIATMFMKRGGEVPGYAPGGTTFADISNDDPAWFDPDVGAGYAKPTRDLTKNVTNGDPSWVIPDVGPGISTVAERFPDLPPAEKNPDFVNAYQDATGHDPRIAKAQADDAVPLPRARADNPPVMAQGDDADASPSPAQAAAAAVDSAPAAAAQALNPYSAPAAADPDEDIAQSFAKSPWLALTTAGLGIAAGTSPFALSNIGSGAMQGVKTLEEQRSAKQKDKTIEQAAKRLEQEAKFHEDQYSKMTPYQKGELELRKEAATYTQMQPVKVGTDFLGRDVMARKDPKTGQYINVMTGKPVEDSQLQLNPQYKIPGTETADNSTLPAHAQYTAGVTAPEGTNPEVLAQLPAMVASKVRAIDEGRASMSSIPMKERGTMLGYVTSYDPNFDQTVWTARNKQQADMSTNGNAGKMILAVNQLLPHLKTASDKAAALDNGNYPGGNAVKNWFATATGDPRVGNFETVREVAAMDAARLLRGSGAMAEKDIEFWRDNLKAAGSPAQLQEKIKLLSDDLMGARISSIQHSYRTNMRMEPPDFISKEAKEALATIKQRNPEPGAAPAPAAAAPAAAPAAKPPTVAQNGHTYTLQPDGTYK